MQQKIMECQIINQNFMMNRQIDELNKVKNKVKRIAFINRSLPISEQYYEKVANYGEKVEDVLNSYLGNFKNFGLPGEKATFQYKGNNVDRNEQRVIEDYFSSSNLHEPIIIVVSYNK